MDTIKSLEALDKSLSTLIEGAPEKGAKLVEWLYIQVPDVVNQLLMWHAVESGVQALFSLFCAVATAVFLVVGTRKFWAWGKSEECMTEPAFVMPLLLVNGIGAIIVCCNIGELLSNLVWLKIWIAPKVYLLEYLAQHISK